MIIIDDMADLGFKKKVNKAEAKHPLLPEFRINV